MNKQDERRFIRALRSGDIGAVRSCIEAGMDVNASFGLGFEQPLDKASESGNPTLVKYLIDKGADVDTPAKLGGGARVRSSVPRALGTALYFALRNGDAESARVLLDHGVSIEATQSKLIYP